MENKKKSGVDNPYDLEEQYQFFLKKIGLDESKMGEVQRKSMKDSFFGACGILLKVFHMDIGKIEDEGEAIREMNGMLKMVEDYWIKRLNEK